MPRGYETPGILRALGLWKSNIVKLLRKTVGFLKHETSIYYYSYGKNFTPGYLFKRNKNIPAEGIDRQVFIAA